MFNKFYFVYINTNKIHSVLYVGVTNNIGKRSWQHKEGVIDSFVKKYNVNKLVYYETFEDINSAIAREKQIKGWTRKKKIALINSLNSAWSDLSYSC